MYDALAQLTIHRKQKLITKSINNNNFKIIFCLVRNYIYSLLMKTGRSVYGFPIANEGATAIPCAHTVKIL